MGQILKSTLIISLVALLTWGATSAFFSDAEESGANVFAAGTLDLKVDNEDGPLSVKVTLQGLRPSSGYGDPIEIEMRNAGSLDGKAYLKFKDIVEEENGITEPEQDAYETTGVVNDIASKILVKVEYKGSVVENNALLAGIENYDINLGDLDAVETATLELYFHLDKKAGNEYQSDRCYFSIEFRLEQRS